VKEISNCERLSCNEVQLFDKNPQRKLDDGVFFLWSGSWCFDPGKRFFFLEYLKPEKYFLEVKLMKKFQEWKSRMVNEVLRTVKKIWVCPLTRTEWSGGIFISIKSVWLLQNQNQTQYELQLQHFFLLKHRWCWKYRRLKGCLWYGVGSEKYLIKLIRWYGAKSCYRNDEFMLKRRAVADGNARKRQEAFHSWAVEKQGGRRYSYGHVARYAWLHKEELAA
jgi:hypothetical protein